MLCCIGLFGGTTVGQSLGGHWTVTAPAIGFALGFLGDLKLVRGFHGKAANPRFKLPPCHSLTVRAAAPEKPLSESPTNRAVGDG